MHDSLNNTMFTQHFNTSHKLRKVYCWANNLLRRYFLMRPAGRVSGDCERGKRTHIYYVCQKIIDNSHGKLKGWFTLYATFPFRRGTSPFSKIFSCVIKRRCSHWQERLRHVSVPFRRRCWERMFDMMERVWTGLNLLDSDNVSSLMSPALHFECLLATSAACFCLQKWMKNEWSWCVNVRNYMTCKIRSVWIEILWGQIGEELKKSVKFQCFFIAHCEVTIILLSTKFQ